MVLRGDDPPARVALQLDLVQQLLRDLLVEERRPLHRDRGILPRARLGFVQQLLAARLAVELLGDPALVVAMVTPRAHVRHLRAPHRVHLVEPRAALVHLLDRARHVRLVLVMVEPAREVASGPALLRLDAGLNALPAQRYALVLVEHLPVVAQHRTGANA